MNEIINIIKEIRPGSRVSSYNANEIEKWMNDHGHLFGKKNRTVFELLNSIVAKGTISKRGQEELLAELEKIKEKELINKAKTLCRSVSEGENIGLELIRELNNQELIRFIHNMAKQHLRKALHSYWDFTEINSDIVFVSLAIIALKQYDSNFYDHVKKEYKELYENYSDQKIEGTIREILRKYKRKDLDDSKRLITSVLMNAIVPQYFLSDYYDFMFDVYKVNLDYQLSDSDDELNFVFNGLYNSLKSSEETDDLNIQATNKTYHLIQSTKLFIISEKKKHFANAIKFSNEILKIIDKNYWNQNNDTNDSYYSLGYDEWVKSHKKDINESKRSRSSKTVFTSRWEPFIYLDKKNKTIVLYPPNHKFKDEVDETKLAIRVFNDKQLIYEKLRPAIVRFIIGGYEIESEKIVVDNPIGKLRYVVSEGNNVIYDSKEKFCRDVFVFDPENGMEIKNNTEYNGDAIFCYKSSNSSVDQFYETEFFKLGTRNVGIGDVLYFGKDPFAFSRILKPGICGDKIKNLHIRTTEGIVPVYKSIDYLMFESELEEDAIVIRRNNRKHKLSSCDFRKTKKELWSQYIVPLSIKESGIYRIAAIDINSNSVIKGTDFTFGIDMDYHCENVRINSTNYRVTICSSFFDDTKRFDVYLPEFEEAKLPFSYENREYMYQIPLSMNLYRIDEGKWKILEDSIWVNDIKPDSTMDIYGDDVKEVATIGFSDTTPKSLEPIACNHRNNITSLKIGHLLSYKNSYSKLILSWKSGELEDRGIWVDNQCEVDKRNSIIEYDPYQKTLVINIKYYGRGPVNVEIADDKDKLIKTIDDIESGGKYLLENLAENRSYVVRAIYKNKGLLISDKKTLLESRITIISYDNLEKTSFKIKSVEHGKTVIDYSNNERGDYVEARASTNMVGTYVRILSKVSDKVYAAEIYRKQDGVKTKLKTINPVKLEIVGEIRNGVMEALITKNNRTLLYDGRHRTIHDEIDKVGANSVYSYLLVLEG